MLWLRDKILEASGIALQKECKRSKGEWYIFEHKLETQLKTPITFEEPFQQTTFDGTKME